MQRCLTCARRLISFCSPHFTAWSPQLGSMVIELQTIKKKKGTFRIVFTIKCQCQSLDGRESRRDGMGGILRR